mmetsp:Transcript_10878/g.39929  ORF Transcript_10878/g.39929 Transcript_10878/m.39929 type:complete len:243 (+) Transcript_10878:740-1468(+)
MGIEGRRGMMQRLLRHPLAGGFLPAGVRLPRSAVPSPGPRGAGLRRALLCGRLALLLGGCSVVGACAMNGPTQAGHAVPLHIHQAVQFTKLCSILALLLHHLLPQALIGVAPKPLVQLQRGRGFGPLVARGGLAFPQVGGKGRAAAIAIRALFLVRRAPGCFLTILQLVGLALHLLLQVLLLQTLDLLHRIGVPAGPRDRVEDVREVHVVRARPYGGLLFFRTAHVLGAAALALRVETGTAV